MMMKKKRKHFWQNSESRIRPNGKRFMLCCKAGFIFFESYNVMNEWIWNEWKLVNMELTFTLRTLWYAWEDSADSLWSLGLSNVAVLFNGHKRELSALSYCTFDAPSACVNSSTGKILHGTSWCVKFIKKCNVFYVCVWETFFSSVKFTSPSMTSFDAYVWFLSILKALRDFSDYFYVLLMSVETPSGMKRNY